MSNMTQLEKVLASALAKATQVDIPAIIEAAQACCIGGCKTEVVVDLGTLGEPERAQPKPEKPPRTKKEVVDVAPLAKAGDKPALTLEPTPEPYPNGGEKPAPVAPAAPTPGVNITGLFTGTGADKKVVKEVFLCAVENAKSMAAINALNATADCGFAFGDFTDNEIEVARRKLKRWGAAQE